jgi:hypothetical protein
VSVLYDLADMQDWLDRLDSFECFFCGVQVTLPCVVWHGNFLVVFHPACARSLGAHLIADSREAELAGDPQPHWRRRAIGTMRYRLIKEEVAA